MRMHLNRLDELPCLTLLSPCLKLNSDHQMLWLLAGALALLSPSALQAVAADHSAIRAGMGGRYIPKVSLRIHAFGSFVSTHIPIYAMRVCVYNSQQQLHHPSRM